MRIITIVTRRFTDSGGESGGSLAIYAAQPHPFRALVGQAVADGRTLHTRLYSRESHEHCNVTTDAAIAKARSHACDHCSDISA